MDDEVFVEEADPNQVAFEEAAGDTPETGDGMRESGLIRTDTEYALSHISETLNELQKAGRTCDILELSLEECPLTLTLTLTLTLYGRIPVYNSTSP